MKLLSVFAVLAAGVSCFAQSSSQDVVHLEMRSKRLTLSASEQGIRYQVADKESALVGKKLDKQTLEKNFPKMHRLLDRSLAPLLATR